ncbi:MAG: phosphoribosylformylglycinamidine synthase subunit PurS [Candidatus Aenigmarchaeota archaeon]|nr:phosphoribosylformylglycinamidine synthase subunit PurS [Candidatus Aenigmarchaeota archaeon]
MADTKPNTLQVAVKPEFPDASAAAVKQDFTERGIKTQNVRTARKITFDFPLSEDDIKRLETELTDPVTEFSAINEQISPGDFDFMVEVSKKPGVADPQGRTAKEIAETILDRGVGEGSAYTSAQYFVKGGTEEELKKAAVAMLANPLIEDMRVYDYRTWDRRTGLHTVPKMVAGNGLRAGYVNLGVDDNALMEISGKGELSLNLREMRTIGSEYQRPSFVQERETFGLGPMPTDVELEVLAQTWSEHCKHKIFNAAVHYVDRETGLTIDIDSLFKTFIKDATEELAKTDKWKDKLVSVFKDNAGIVKFNNMWNMLMKVETHNSPSAKDPYGGALTGVNGCHRDIMGAGVGAELIASTDVLCFADPDYAGYLPSTILHPDRVRKGVFKGIEHAGNKTGIPTVNGSVFFHDSFLGKPLVFCGSVGVMPAEINGRKTEEKVIEPGYLAVMVGGRVGKDGIHGATFSSGTLHEKSPSSAVQIGDPIVQKRAYDFLIRARDLGLIEAITDNGAGGLSSSIGELAQISGGCEIYLDRVPLKYAGMQPWEILISESQERMTAAVKPEKITEFEELSRKYRVESSVVGKFTDSGKLHATYGSDVVAHLDMEFLHNGVPKMELEAEWQRILHNDDPIIADDSDLTAELTRILARPNIASKEKMVRRFDHEVQGGSAGKPFVGAQNDGPADAAVLRPFLDSNEGIILSHGINPLYGQIDTYHMTANAIDEAIRGVIAVGGDMERIVFNDNFCWPSPLEDKHKMAQLVRANMALRNYCLEYETPCISGKDSMTIDTEYTDQEGNKQKVSGLPTVMMSAMAKMDDARNFVSMDAKMPGDIVYVLGVTKDEMGGSEFYTSRGAVGDSVPVVDAKSAKVLYKSLAEATKHGLAASIHDASQGGLGVALAETAFAGGYGMDVNLSKLPTQDVDKNYKALFSESASRFVVTVDPAKADEFEKTMGSVQYARVGNVRAGDSFYVRGLDGRTVITASIYGLKDAWQSRFGWN